MFCFLLALLLVENPVVSSSASCTTYTSIPNQTSQSRRRRGRRLTRAISPTHVPQIKKRQSLQANTALSIRNRELAFRQLAEQLWAAGLPSSRTACALSIRSRCSSAPPSERGVDDEMTKISWKNGSNDEQENTIDWDEPDQPDEDFGRYASQGEFPKEESNGHNEWTQQSTLQTTATDDMPSFLSISTPPIVTQTVTPSQVTIPVANFQEDAEPLRFIQHGPGPIQRPTKLTNPSSQPLRRSSYFINSIQSPEPSDVLDQINRLLDHQSITTPTVSSTSNVNDPSAPINDLGTPNIPWTPFLPTSWPSKYDSSWPSTSIQTPTGSLTIPVQNPFALMSTLNDQQRPPTREESMLWSTIGGAVTPHSIPSSSRTQRVAQWNDMFSATVPSTTESTKSTNNSWLKLWSPSDPNATDGISPNVHEITTNNTLWNIDTLTNQPGIPPSTLNQQQEPSSTWWSNSSSDENNNNNSSQINHLHDDTINNRDRSRWDFAR